MLLRFAKSDLLCVGKVVADVLRRIAVGLHGLVVGKLHSLQGWGDIVGEFQDCVGRLLSEGLGVSNISIVDALDFLSFSYELIHQHLGGDLLW